jgi:DNA polymerase III delta prime subunit
MMGTPAAANNQAYLEAALTWLRLCLKAAAKPATAHAPAATVAPPRREEPRRAWWPLSRWRAFAVMDESAPSTSLPSEKSDPATEAADVARAREARDAAARVEPTPALPALTRALNLTEFESDILLLCAAMELDPELQDLLRDVAGGEGHGWPTINAAAATFPGPHSGVLSPIGPLRQLRLVEVNQSGMQPLIAAPLRIDERIGAYIAGSNYLDERLAAIMPSVGSGFDLVEDAVESLSASQRLGVAEGVTLARAAGAPPHDLRIQLTGADSATRRTYAREIAAGLGLDARILNAEGLPPAGESEALLRLWDRETRLLPLLLLVELPDNDLSSEAGGSPSRARLLGLAARAPGLTLVSTLDPVTQTLAGGALIETVRPTPDEQAQAWRVALGEDSAEAADALAAQFSLSIAAIHAIAERTLAAHDPAAPTSLRNELWRACVRYSRPALEGLAQKIEARQPWSALKLRDREAATLARIRDHMRHRATVHGAFGFRQHMTRGLGTAVLFSGESGTGKTLAAEVLAAELGLDLYRIDISGVMNKYVGVTEKNLRQIFDAGDGAVLFFDECDALFAKRSEVNDSKDRYANIQVDYLLQRIESYRGLAILATNLRDAIDPAFLRRLRFIVSFPFPGVAERAAIWRNALPPDAPKAGLDFDQLGRLQLSGGNIQNVALDAAFRAAAAGGPITMALIAEAAQDELRKIDRPPSAAQIRALNTHRQAS